MPKTHIYTSDSYEWREYGSTWALCGRVRAIGEMYRERSGALAKISDSTNICRTCWKKFDRYNWVTGLGNWGGGGQPTLPSPHRSTDASERP